MQRSTLVFLSALTLALVSLTSPAQSQVFSVAAEPDSLGAIPDAISEGPGNYGASLDVRFEVDGTQGNVGSIGVEFSANHQFVGDLRVRLVAPDGTEHLLFEQTGVSIDDSDGFDSNLIESAVYSFSDAASVHWWTATDIDDDVPSTSARTNRSGNINAPPACPN